MVLLENLLLSNSASFRVALGVWLSIFSEYFRYNVDPFSKYTDDEIWDAIEKVHMKDKVIIIEVIIYQEIPNIQHGCMKPTLLYPRWPNIPMHDHV